jgi:hypothetical protein
MKFDQTNRRYTCKTQSDFPPSVEWYELPELGARADHHLRALVWRAILLGSAVFWAGVIWAIQN